MYTVSNYYVAIILQHIDKYFDLLFQNWATQNKQSGRTDLKHIPVTKVTENDSGDKKPDSRSILHVAIELTQKLEKSIPRAYLKPPLIRKGGNTEFSNTIPSLSEAG